MGNLWWEVGSGKWEVGNGGRDGKLEVGFTATDSCIFLARRFVNIALDLFCNNAAKLKFKQLEGPEGLYAIKNEISKNIGNI